MKLLDRPLNIELLEKLCKEGKCSSTDVANAREHNLRFYLNNPNKNKKFRDQIGIYSESINTYGSFNDSCISEPEEIVEHDYHGNSLNYHGYY